MYVCMHVRMYVNNRKNRKFREMFSKRSKKILTNFEKKMSKTFATKGFKKEFARCILLRKLLKIIARTSAHLCDQFLARHMVPLKKED